MEPLSVLIKIIRDVISKVISLLKSGNIKEAQKTLEKLEKDLDK
jgi:hypothetical protein